MLTKYLKSLFPLAVVLVLGLLWAGISNVVYAQNTNSERLEQQHIYWVIEQMRDSDPEELPSFLDQIQSPDDLSNLSQSEQAALDAFLLDEALEYYIGGVEQALPPSPAYCFDYYNFGSVNASLYGDATPAAGTEAEFTVTITNNNPYPILDAGLYIKVFRVPTDGSPHLHEPDIVEQKFVLEDKVLPAEGSVEKTFSWHIPNNAPSGQYRIGTFVSSAQRYNFSGLPFTDDIVGNYFDFSVSGESVGAVSWQKNQVILNGQQYTFASFNPRVHTNEVVRVVVPLRNTTPDPVNAEVRWDLYQWDQQRTEHLVRTDTQTISLDAGDSVFVDHQVPESDSDVYMLVGTVTHGEMTHVVNLRFVREGIGNVRINHPGVNLYPLEADQPRTLFSCFHSTGGLPVVESGRMELVLTDNHTGRVIHSHEYVGPITGEMMAIADTFVPRRTYDNFTLTARLFQADDLVEEVSYTYDCAILSEECRVPEQTLLSSLYQDISERPMTYLILTFFAAIALALLVWWYRPRPRATFVSLMVIVMITGVGLLGTPSSAQAQISAQTTDFRFGPMYFRSARTDSSFNNRYYQAMASPLAVVRYTTVIYNHTNNQVVPPFGRVAVGDELEVRPHLGQITWNAAGHAFDTPRGMWYENAAFPFSPIERSGGTVRRFYITPCPEEYLIDALRGRLNLDIYIPLVVHPPTTNVTPPSAPDPASPNPVEILGNNRYRVSESGRLDFLVNYANTYGHYYYMYRFGNRCAVSRDATPIKAARGNNQPPYEARFSAVTINYPVYADLLNNPPHPPEISGPTTGLTGESYQFSIRGTDPDDDMIFYEIDWNNNGEVNQRLPGGAVVVPSNTQLTAARSWPIPGAYTFSARTVDETGRRSDWSSHTITLNQPNTVTVNLQASVDDDNFSASDRTVVPGAEVRLAWTSDADTCTSADFDTEGAANNPSGVLVNLPADGNSRMYTIECSREGLTATDLITVTVNSVPPPVIIFEHNLDGADVWQTGDRVVAPNREFQVRWSASPATECNAMNDFNPGDIGTSSPDVLPNVMGPTEGNSRTYTIHCTNRVGDQEAQSISTFNVAALGDVAVSLEVRVNNGPWQNNDVIVGSNDTVHLRFSSTNAQECSSINFDIGEELNGIVPVSPEPVQGQAETYTFTCENASGSNDTAQRSVELSDLPDFEPTDFVNPELPEEDGEEGGIDFDDITGTYDMTLAFNITNQGQGIAPAAEHNLEVFIGGATTSTYTRDFSTNQLQGGQPQPITGMLFQNIPVGEVIRVVITANLDIEQVRLDNNIKEYEFGLLGPRDPGMELWLEPQIIRSGQRATVHWNTVAEYDLDCSLRGPGISVDNFNPAVQGPTGNAETTERRNFSEYLLTCRHEPSGSEFYANAELEVIPAIQER